MTGFQLEGRGSMSSLEEETLGPSLPQTGCRASGQQQRDTRALFRGWEEAQTNLHCEVETCSYIEQYLVCSRVYTNTNMSPGVILIYCQADAQGHSKEVSSGLHKVRQVSLLQDFSGP